MIAAVFRANVPWRICCAAMRAIAMTTAAFATLMATSPRASPYSIHSPEATAPWSVPFGAMPSTVCCR